MITQNAEVLNEQSKEFLKEVNLHHGALYSEFGTTNKTVTISMSSAEFNKFVNNIKKVVDAI